MSKQYKQLYWKILDDKILNLSIHLVLHCGYIKNLLHISPKWNEYLWGIFNHFSHVMIS